MTNSANGGQLPLVPTKALWSWDMSGTPTVTGFPQGINGAGVAQYTPTKTGLMPQDLKAFVGVPLQYYGPNPMVVNDSTLIQWIRYAEDLVEQETSILLCQTWVAAGPAQAPGQAAALGLAVNNTSGYQVPGLDYDLADSPYDFMFKNAQDEAWMIQILRYRPIQSLGYTPADYTAIKNTCYVYPLLNTYFRIPVSWNVEERDYGMVRFVPAQNVQMLPLFAMQLAFMGFAENVPGAIWFQYTAGLTPYDYQSRYAFIKQLVLCNAAMIALSAVQGTINLGAISIDTMVDGLRQQLKYSERGPFSALIDNFQKRADSLMTTARSKVSGPMVTML